MKTTLDLYLVGGAFWGSFPQSPFFDLKKRAQLNSSIIIITII